MIVSQGAEEGSRKGSAVGSPVLPKMNLSDGKQIVSASRTDQIREVPKNLAWGVANSGLVFFRRFRRALFSFFVSRRSGKYRKGLAIPSGVLYNIGTERSMANKNG